MAPEPAARIHIPHLAPRWACMTRQNPEVAVEEVTVSSVLMQCKARPAVSDQKLDMPHLWHRRKAQRQKTEHRLFQGDLMLTRRVSCALVLMLDHALPYFFPSWIRHHLQKTWWHVHLGSSILHVLQTNSGPPPVHLCAFKTPTDAAFDKSHVAPRNRPSCTQNSEGLSALEEDLVPLLSKPIMPSPRTGVRVVIRAICTIR
ncbi:uncharacterized protein F5Z01DRAFT_648734 [Emericellopsis atlantica]|uniref:Uncharacterized protein n=1 Tax=Emericellopsis atlantica TaxID=2614577 RepID=A0A9P7ZR75_9HYPO|nr:uncharacterized protein F5Z01DRAFT_648734 [Emericellopsis atlantica]KAG9256616.1 hypothetical protein F5Z01DRAFT_648734 [Emericellopsis atlantica]